MPTTLFLRSKKRKPPDGLISKAHALNPGLFGTHNAKGLGLGGGMHTEDEMATLDACLGVKEPSIEKAEKAPKKKRVKIRKKGDLDGQDI